MKLPFTITILADITIHSYIRRLYTLFTVSVLCWRTPVFIILCVCMCVCDSAWMLGWTRVDSWPEARPQLSHWATAPAKRCPIQQLHNHQGGTYNEPSIIGPGRRYRIRTPNRRTNTKEDSLKSEINLRRD